MRRRRRAARRLIFVGLLFQLACSGTLSSPTRESAPLRIVVTAATAGDYTDLSLGATLQLKAMAEYQNAPPRDVTGVVAQVTTPRSDCRWTARSDSSWLHQYSSGDSYDPGKSGDGHFEFEMDANNSLTPRVGNIEVTFTDGTTLRYAVNQRGMRVAPIYSRRRRSRCRPMADRARSR